MSDQSQPNKNINVNFNGQVSGQVSFGDQVNMTQNVTNVTGQVTQEEMAQLTEVFQNLRTQVEDVAKTDKEKEAAIERVEELREAITTEEPDVSTMEYVKRWFTKNLPSVAGTITGVLVHPVVGKLVSSAGEAISDEFKRRFET